MKINNAVFLNYLLCPYKAVLLLGHQSAPPTTYQALAEDTAVRYEPLAREAISRLSPDVVLSPDGAKLASVLRQGPSVILDATIEIGDFEFHFDALKRCSPKGSSAEPHYIHSWKRAPCVSKCSKLSRNGGRCRHLKKAGEEWLPRLDSN